MAIVAQALQSSDRGAKGSWKGLAFGHDALLLALPLSAGKAVVILQSAEALIQGEDDSSVNTSKHGYSSPEGAQLRMPWVNLRLHGIALAVTPPFAPPKTGVEGMLPRDPDDSHSGQMFIQTTPGNMLGQSIR